MKCSKLLKAALRGILSIESVAPVLVPIVSNKFYFVIL